jgi:hypothetical protein
MQRQATTPAERIRHFFESGAYKPWFAGAVVCLLLSGAWLRFSLPLPPITNKDSGGYISPALSLLVNGTYEASHRNFPYPGFVWALLKMSGTFSSITVAQHLLGLAGGLIFWLAWLRLGVFLPRDWRVTALHAVLGVGLVWGLLLSDQPVFFEHSMRPEAIYPFLISLHLFGAVKFLERSLLRRSLPAAIGWGALMTAVSFGLYVLKPIWGLALISGGLPFVMVVLLTHGKWRGVPFVAAAVGAAVGFALFFVPESVLSPSTPRNASLINQQLFFVHANLIDREIRRDLEKPGEPPFPRELLLATVNEFSVGRAQVERRPFRTLGFSPDYLMYGKADLQVQKHFQDQPGGANRFYRYYYLRAWLGQPIPMMRKIFGELSVFYRCDGKLTRAGSTLKLRTTYGESTAIHDEPYYLQHFREWGPLKDYVEAVRGVTASDEPYRLDLMLAFLSAVNAAYVFILGLFLVAGFLWGRESARKTGGVPLLWLGIWIFSYNFGITLTVALVHSMSIQRYTDTQFCLTLFSFCAGLLLLVSILLSRFSPLPCPDTEISGAGAAANRD